MGNKLESEKQYLLAEVEKVYIQAERTIKVARVVAIVCSIALIVAYASILIAVLKITGVF